MVASDDNKYKLETPENGWLVDGDGTTANDTEDRFLRMSTRPMTVGSATSRSNKSNTVYVW